jgi:hypothetical protein
MAEDRVSVYPEQNWLLASHEAVALSSVRTHVQMEQAVATRHQIGEAMGILMSSHRLTDDQAFDVLRRYSRTTSKYARWPGSLRVRAPDPRGFKATEGPSA